MKITNLELAGLKLVELDVYKDNRGFFTERFKKSAAIGSGFVQDNHSRSAAGVIRGLHFQANPNQAKLVSVTRGRIIDVAVDIRHKSASFGEHLAIELDETKMLYIPAGFAHGFAALEESDVLYKVDGYYNPTGEGSIRFNDPELNINWQVTKPIVSDKDKNAKSFAEYKQNPIF